MTLKRIEIHNFRNFIHQTCEPSAGVNIFVGKNGQGKTNFVEAIYAACRGGSFRPGPLSTLVRHESDGSAQVRAQFSVKALGFDVEVRLGGQARSMVLNGKSTRSATFLRQFPLVLFSPESLNAIKEGPQVRRDLIDGFLASHRPENAVLLSDFHKCLRSRNRLLSDCKKGLYTARTALDVLDSIHGTYWRLASALTHARILALRDIFTEFSECVHQTLSPNNVDISVDYLMSGKSVFAWDEHQIRDEILRRLSELRSREMDSGNSLVGPHKHDIQFLLAGRDSRFFSSQGQQRAVILSFKMAQIMYHYRVYGQYPILILDDVLSELDQEKRSNLIGFLQRINSQIFLTTTEILDPGAFESQTGLAVYELNSGTIVKRR